MPLPLVYNRVHAMVGEKAFDSWMETLETKENAAYEKVPSDHGWTNVTYVRYVRPSRKTSFRLEAISNPSVRRS